MSEPILLSVEHDTRYDYSAPVELAEYAAVDFTPGRPLAEAAVALMQRIHAEFSYSSEATEVNTPVIDAFRQKRGVCQDFAQVMIGGLRGLGLAARYVSGYLLTEPLPGEAKLQGADASHAWVAVYCPDSGLPADWLGPDPPHHKPAGRPHLG